jgi:hypothetical protein
MGFFPETKACKSYNLQAFPFLVNQYRLNNFSRNAFVKPSCRQLAFTKTKTSAKHCAYFVFVNAGIPFQMQLCPVYPRELFRFVKSEHLLC